MKSIDMRRIKITTPDGRFVAQLGPFFKPNSPEDQFAVDVYIALNEMFVQRQMAYQAVYEFVREINED